MKKCEPFCVSKLLFWGQKWVAGVRHGNSLVVRRVSPGRIIVVFFWTKYAVPRKIEPRILKLTTSRGQRNLRTVFIFVSCEQKGCYRIVSLGHLIFDCRSYCGLSCRILDVAWLGKCVPRNQTPAFVSAFELDLQSDKMAENWASHKCTMYRNEFNF